MVLCLESRHSMLESLLQSANMAVDSSKVLSLKNFSCQREETHSELWVPVMESFKYLIFT
jgi:hypothetical protein